MMYKRTKGECKGKSRLRSLQDETVDLMLELMDEGASPISLIVSPRRRVAELKSIFETEGEMFQFEIESCGLRLWSYSRLNRPERKGRCLALVPYVPPVTRGLRSL